MVKYVEIQRANSSFRAQRGAYLTAVFVGATNGIGLSSLHAFVKHTQEDSPTIYVVGRSLQKLESLSNTISVLNASARVVSIQANDLTLVEDAQAAALKIAESADKIDFLIMSPGYISLKRNESPEGLDRLQAIQYYSRMQFLLTLAPLLQKSTSPRVVTVLGGGKEGQLWPEDWTLKEHYNVVNEIRASASMTSLFLEEFAKQPGNDKISLVHVSPGLVGGTGLAIDGLPKWVQAIMNWVSKGFLHWFGYAVEEAGERVLYAATSKKFPASNGAGEAGTVERGSNGDLGSGVYLVDADSSAIPGNKVLGALRDQDVGKKVWQHTIDVLIVRRPTI